MVTIKKIKALLKEYKMTEAELLEILKRKLNRTEEKESRN